MNFIEDDLFNGFSIIHHLARENCKKRWDMIAKPINGLGLFEELIIKIAGIQGTEEVCIDRKAIVVFCSDNGVVEEGVTQTDSSVTALVAENMTKGVTSVNLMANYTHTKVIPVDIGVNQDIYLDGILHKKIGKGTKNIAKEPAMSREEALKGIQIGMELVRELKEQGYHILGTGEMGIGNTTTSSAVASVLLDVPVEEVTGKGAGLSKDGILQKIAVIKKAIERNKPAKEDPIDVLAKLGGFDIAGMTGMFLGGAKYGIPIIIDGLISAVSAYLAVMINKECLEFMIPSHVGKEPASVIIMNKLGLNPVIHGNLALGEGTGTALLFSMLETISKVYQYNNTFEDINLTPYEDYTKNEV